MKTFFDTFDETFAIFKENVNAPEEITDAYFTEKIVVRTAENYELFDQRLE